MVSIVIVNWNTREFLLACLASIFRFPPTRDFEVIVVDNHSQDGSETAARTAFPQATIIQSGANAGYAKGNNIGFAQARGEYILTLNPDTELIDNSLEIACGLLDNRPRVAAVGIRQVEPNGRVQRSVRGFPTVAGIIGDVTGLGKRQSGSKWDSYRLSGMDYNRESTGGQPMGTFNLLRKTALAEIGDPHQPFDEQFPIFFNEVDLLYRLQQAGWEILYTPQAQILHHGGESTRQVRKSMVWESHRSLLRYFRKHRIVPKFLYPGIAIMVWAGAWVRARGFSAGFRP